MAGRYKGRKNGVVRKWQPETWKPKYDIIVSLYVGGAKQGVIAAATKLTVVQVNMILNSEMGREKVAQFAARQRERLDQSMGERTDNLIDKAFDNVVRVVNDPLLLQDNPFAVFNASMQVLKGQGKFIQDKAKEEAPPVTNNTNNFFIQNPEVAARVADGLQKVMEVSKLPNAASNNDKK